MTPINTLLHAVQRLHDYGFEQLRIKPYVYSLGTWRCELTIGGAVDTWPDDAFFRYSSANEWDYFSDDDDEPSTVDRLANRLQERLPVAALAKQPSPGYRFWYAALLERCGAHGVPVFRTDYENHVSEGHVAIVGDGNGAATEGRFPLPPSR